MVLNVLLDVAHLKIGFVVRMVSPVHLVHANETKNEHIMKAIVIFGYHLTFFCLKCERYSLFLLFYLYVSILSLFSLMAFLDTKITQSLLKLFLDNLLI